MLIADCEGVDQDFFRLVRAASIVSNSPAQRSGSILGGVLFTPLGIKLHQMMVEGLPSSDRPLQ